MVDHHLLSFQPILSQNVSIQDMMPSLGTWKFIGKFIKTKLPLSLSEALSAQASSTTNSFAMASWRPSGFGLLTCYPAPRFGIQTAAGEETPFLQRTRGQTREVKKVAGWCDWLSQWWWTLVVDTSSRSSKVLKWWRWWWRQWSFDKHLESVIIYITYYMYTA